jgi:hypothetical protein
MRKTIAIGLRDGRSVEVVWHDSGYSAETFNALVRHEEDAELIGLIGYFGETTYCSPIKDLVGHKETMGLLQEILAAFFIRNKLLASV